MEKTKLMKVIEKHHLNKRIEPSCWSITDNKLKIDFLSEYKDLIGFLTTDIQLEDAEFGISSTSQLLSLVGITDDTLLISFKKHNNIPTKLSIEDNTFSLLYSLSDIMMIERPKSVNLPPHSTTTIDIQDDFVVKYLRAKKALSESKEVSICLGYNDQQEKVAWFTLGGEEQYTNKIKFSTYCDFENNVYEDISFDGNTIRDILAVNKNADSIKLTLWQEGLMRIETIEEDIKVEYYLVPLQQ